MLHVCMQVPLARQVLLRSEQGLPLHKVPS